MPACILLIVIDCLRADHVSCYGYERKTTPTIDQLAAEGLVWDSAHSASSWTKPSVVSLLTGLYPSQHGAYQGVKRSKGRLITTDVLNPECATLASVLAAAGWRCGAFLNNAQLDTFTGIDRGFETYEPQAGQADEILERFGAWMNATDGRPVFAYLHFLEAHWPYKPRRRHIEMFGGNRDTNYFRDFRARDYGRLRKSMSRGAADITPDQRHQMIQMYDGAIRRLDGKVRVALSILKDHGVFNDSVITITADHGEEFLDHGHIGHGQSLYDELTHVPLILSGPEGRGRERRTAPVSHVDLARTLLDAAGVESDLPGVNLIQNDSGRPSISELRIQRRYTQALRNGSWKLHRQFIFDPGEQADISRMSTAEMMAKLPYRTRCELYDLTDDSGELENLADDIEALAIVQDMSTDLDRWWATCAGSSAASECEIDDRVVERLRDLGYIE